MPAATTLQVARAHTGRDLTRDEALRIIGPANVPYARNMVRALSSFAWRNTPEEWLRLQAAIVVSKGRKQ